MQVKPLRNILIIGHARTGGTWVGNLLNTAPNVKYLWEPNSLEHHRKDQMPAWDLNDPIAVWCRVYLFKPHVPIRPEFPKGEIDTAVYKLHTVLGDIARHPVKWNAALFERVRNALDAKVIHLVRHPTRWAASILRWGAKHLTLPSHELYARSNREFHDRYSGKDWYRLFRHEDLLASRDYIDGLFGFSGLDQGQAFVEYQAEMHSEDRDIEPDHHSTVMKSSTVLDRWQSMPPKAFEISERFTEEHWSWAGYQPFPSEKVAP